jgi:hypothetical protein
MDYRLDGTRRAKEMGWCGGWKAKAKTAGDVLTVLARG